MFIFDCNNRKPVLLLCFFLFMIGGIITVGAVMGDEGDGEEEAPEVYLEMAVPEDHDTGDRTVYVCTSIPLSQIGGGGVMAFSLTVEMGSGWSFGEVTACEGAEGMTVTCNRVETQGGIQLRCLIDGSPPAAEGEWELPILKITAVRTCADRPFRIWIKESSGIYYRDAENRICIRPIVHETDAVEDTLPDTDEGTDSAGPDEETRDPSREESQEETRVETRDETREDPIWQTEAETTAGTAPPSEREPMLGASYVGCQETPVRDEEYAVRFLFLGETPVLCAEGGGYLEMEIERRSCVEALVDGEIRTYGGDFSVCTVRGLRAERRYEFLVYTEEGPILITYAGGRYGGITEKSRPANCGPTEKENIYP